MNTITDKEFQLLTSFIYDKFGIHLGEQKKGMVSARLNKILNRLGMNSFTEYYDFVSKDKTGKGVSDLINAISTNHTFFWRESVHFKFFQDKAFPEMLNLEKKRNGRDVRVWSAGCSSGEEPYTLVMLMMELLGSEYNLWDSGVLATDIDTEVLKRAMDGVYPPDRLELLPAQYKLKYMRKNNDSDYEIIESVKREVTFRRLNLMNPEFPFKKQFHIIFCRNVMIYFDKPTRDALLKRFYDALVPGGYFFIGHSETIDKAVHRFEYIMPALYKKPDR